MMFLNSKKIFRVTVQMLTNEFGFSVKIPTCNQLESDEEKDLNDNKKLANQLTMKQTTETRFVTKVKI